jgi:hypothetical protein
MSRRSVLFGTAILLLFAGSAGAALVLLLRHEPNFYRRAAVPPGPERKALSGGFFGQAVSFRNHIKEDAEWHDTFSEEQINSFLEDDLVRSEGSPFRLPGHITDPRVTLEPDRIRLGFRYHVGRFSTVVSIDMGVWLTTAESNVVALELRRMRAGALPVSAQSILERLTEAADSNNIKVAWYRHDGNPVAILRFQSDQPHPTVLLENLDLHPGKIYIKGRSLEPSPFMPAPQAKP